MDFAQGELRIQRRRGHTYLNDRRLANLPEFYRQMLPLVIEHFEGVEIPHEQAMHNWLRSLRNRPRVFQLEGVVLELENGDEHVVPFFVFAEPERKLLKTGWADCLAALRPSGATPAVSLEAGRRMFNQEQLREIA